MDGNIGPALFVGASFVSAYLLVRYWRDLSDQKGKVRNSLLGLRAASLLLMTCALGGLHFEYESASRARVLLKSTRSADTAVAQKTIDALEENNFEVIRANTEMEAESSEQDGSYVAAILLTDGAASAKGARHAVESASAAVGGAPVFVVTNLKSQSGEPVVTLERVAIVGRASRGVALTVRCFVYARGMQGRESLVTVSDDAKVQTAARVAWATNEERQVVTLNIVPKVSGWINYTAKVEAAGGEDIERRTRPFTLYVEERRLRVLFFEGEPTWEAKFIRRALDEAGLFDVDYFAQVSRAAVAGVSESGTEQEAGAEERSASNEVAQGGAPEAKLRAALQSQARLNAYDCVIVGASPDSLLSAAESARLSEWVGRRGGGLIILGGNSFQGSIVAPGGKLNLLVPAQISPQSFPSSQSQDVGRGRPLEAEKTRGAILLTPTETGASGALTGYLKAIEESETKAFGLTGQGLRLRTLRAGASVLAVTGQATAGGTSEDGVVQIAAMRYGAGRSLVFAPADSWRIRTSATASADDAAGPFGALWQGLVLWTAEGARPPVEIVLSDDSPSEGSTVLAEIRVRDAAFTSLKIEKISAHLQPLTENAEESSPAATLPQEVAFKPDSADANIWRAELALPSRGRFALEADYVAQGRSGNIEKQFSVVPAHLFAEGISWDTLRRVSREHGGDLMYAASLDSLIQRLTATASKGEPERYTWELRSWWPLAFLLPLLLSAEWFARRWWKRD